MADTLVTALTARIQGTRRVGMGLGTETYPATVEESLNWPDGSGANQADEMWTDDAGSVAATAFVNLDLFALAQVDDDGDPVRNVSLANVKAIEIRNTSSADYLTVGGGTGGGGETDAWIDAVGTEGWLFADNDLMNIPAGGGICIWFPSGVTVTNTTSHILCIAGKTSTQTYEIIIIGDAV